MVAFEHIVCPACGCSSSSVKDAQLSCARCGQQFDYDGFILDLRTDKSRDTRLDTTDYEETTSVNEDITRSIVDQYRNYIGTRLDPYISDVLEIGCGAGKLTRGLLAYTPYRRIHACDISPLFMRRMTSLFPGALREGRLLLYLIDANALPFEQNSFDLIVGHSVLHHLADFERTLRDVHRLLKPGCFAIFGEPVMDAYVLIALVARLMYERKSAFSEQELEALQVLADLPKHRSENLRADRSTLDEEDKFVFSVSEMRQLARQLKFSDFTYYNAETAAVGEIVFSEIRQHLMWEVGDPRLERFFYLRDALDHTIGAGLAPHIAQPFGFFAFRK